MKTQGTFMRNNWRTYGVPREADGVEWGKSWSTFRLPKILFLHANSFLQLFYAQKRLGS